MGEDRSLEALVQALNQAGQRLDTPELDPNPDRAGADLAPFEALRALVEQEILAPLDGLLAGLSDAEQAKVKGAVAGILSSLAASAAAKGRDSAARDLLSRAEALAPDAKAGKFHSAGRRNVKDHARLVWAGRLARRGQTTAAEKIWQAVQKEATEPVHREWATQALSAPRPITSAPPLFRINGFGVGLYGERDKEEDGSYVATLCLCALFIPVFPLTAYRVFARGGGAYSFVGKVPLSKFASGFRWVVAAAVLLLVGGSAVNGYLESPDRRAQQQFAKAEALAKQGDTHGAAAAYEQALGEFSTRADPSLVKQGALRWVQLRTGEVKEPVAAKDVDTLNGLLLRFAQIPLAASQGAPAELIAEKGLGWADQLAANPAADPAAQQALLTRLFEVLSGVAKDKVKTRLYTLRLARADALRERWPFHAFSLYAQMLEDPRALEAAAQVLDDAGDRPSLYLENEAEIGRWLQLAQGAKGHEARCKTVSERMQAAKRLLQAAGRDELLSGHDDAALEKAAKDTPKDQELQVAWASELRAKGDLKAATARLDQLGSVGLLISDGHLLAALLADEQGHRDRADELLTAYLDRWLARFLDVRKQLTEGARRLEDQLVASAKAGHLPMDLEAKLNREPNEEKQQQLFGEYLRNQLQNNRELNRLRDEYRRYNGVVLAAIHLGTMRLMEANEQQGDKRQALLADAERYFLSVREEAEGRPEYHINLGHVFHQLGKTEEGDKELAGVLATADYALHMQVAGVYRELGLNQKAIEVAKKVFEQASEASLRDDAALMLAVITDDAQEAISWLEKVKSKSPQVEAHLHSSKAQQFRHEGKLAEADKEFAAELAIWEKGGKSSAVSLNNASTAAHGRFEVTGDPAMLEKATQLLETAMRMDPDNAIQLRNALALYQQRGTLSLLEKRVHLKALRLTAAESQDLLGALAAGALEKEIAAALKVNPWNRRGLEIAHRLEVLAPKETEGWGYEVGSLALEDDRPGLTALKERVKVAGPFFDEKSAATVRYESGSDDDTLRAAAKLRRAAFEAVNDPQPETQAVALWMRARSLMNVARLDGSAEQVREADRLYAEANKLWPALRYETSRPAVLFDLAVYETGAASAPLGSALKADGRRKSVPVLVDGLPDTWPELKKRPAVAEAVAAVAGLKDDDLGTTAWELGTITGDKALQERSAKALATPKGLLLAEISEILFPRGADELKLVRKAIGAH